MKSTNNSPSNLPPEASSRARGFARMFARPVERFLHVQASSGILLLVMAVIALVWANSPWASSYEQLLHTPISFGFGEYVFTQTAHFWINEILMVVFFFVVGLEIRREIFQGELSSLRRAMFPLAAAIGGMLVPAAIYFSFNSGLPTSHGWGVPMATDIAFAVGVLALLGRRVPATVRVLLLTLAIIDDIGAVLIIAIFYSSGVALSGFVVVGLGISVVVLMQRVGLRNSFLFIPPGIMIWVGMVHAGIHPSIAGVLLGLLTPARSWFGLKGFLAETEQAIDNLRVSDATDGDARKFLSDLERIRIASREAVPPGTRIEAVLHPWVAFGIMPIFAFANAGVSFGGLDAGSATAMRIALGVSLGLVVGKPLGIIAFSWLAVRLGFTSLPRGVSWAAVLVVGCVAGIGFTMALFIGALAFQDASMLAVAKLAVLVASVISGAVGLTVGFMLLQRSKPTVIDAEKSDSAV